jgi:RNA polymerase sigma factor (TIGR02999 family)
MNQRAADTSAVSVTGLLHRACGGDDAAAAELLPLVYDHLRRLAARKMRAERPDLTLQATALVHEAYVRLVDVERTQGWVSRGHFFAAAAEAMRRILIENARRKQSEKHGGKLSRQPLDGLEVGAEAAGEDLLALDQALSKLADEDPAKAQLVKLRYFAGLSVEEAAQALGISRATADRYWHYAKVWLYCALHGGDDPRGRPENPPGA